MSKSIYLVNPRSEFPSYFGAEVYAHFGLPPAHSIADLATATVAAMAPDDWDVRIGDEYVEDLDFDVEADFVGITGKITQGSRMVQVAHEFRRRGRTVVIGGPYASLSPERLREHCDILVIGELEGIAETFFADLESGTWREEYRGDQPDLADSPLPRWDLYPNHRALSGCVQTSRGCPFECEFCDVIQYLGRKQRHKPTEQILAELEALYALGYREVFLADDNFTVYRKRAKEVLAALVEWNQARSGGPVAFSTQVSIDAAKDEEILELLGLAGVANVFIGIETPNAESLKESKKRQNLGVDLMGQVEKFLHHGVAVQGGMIVGFDADGLDSFRIQLDFAMSAPIPIFSVGALVAPAATPLHDRMEASGRLIEGGSETAASPLDTNIIPSRMTREQLFEGLKWLGNQLYRPDNFARRMVRTIETFEPRRGALAGSRRALRAVDAEAVAVIRKITQAGPAEERMWSTILEAMRDKPASAEIVGRAVFQYAQVRCLYEAGCFWEPHPSDEPRFAAAPHDPAVAGLRVLS